MKTLFTVLALFISTTALAQVADIVGNFDNGNQAVCIKDLKFTHGCFVKAPGGIKLLVGSPYMNMRHLRLEEKMIRNDFFVVTESRPGFLFGNHNEIQFINKNGEVAWMFDSPRPAIDSLVTEMGTLVIGFENGEVLELDPYKKEVSKRN